MRPLVFELVLASGNPFQNEAPGTLHRESLRCSPPPLTCFYLAKDQETSNESKLFSDRMADMKKLP
jgi:hypothetical protein